MHRFLIGLATATVLVLGTTGCGGGGESVATETAPGAEASPAAPAETPQAPDEGQWQTVGTLSSSDPSMEGYEGLLVSQPFDVSGEAQVVLDMPDAGAVDGVNLAIIRADKASDPMTILGALRDEDTRHVILLASMGSEQVSGLDGTYVLINSTPVTLAWSVELQTR